MSDTVRLSVVIPAHNEAARIGQSLRTLLDELPAEGRPCELRVVDDGSLDETAKVVASFARSNPCVVLQREPHRGKGGALRAGLLAARGDLRFMCDADLSMPVSELRRFLAEVPGRCDIAIGTREGLGARRVGEPFYRHVMGRLFNGLVRTSALSRVADTQCGFKMFSASAVEAIVPWTTIDGWAIDIEMLFLATLRGLRVKEIPIEWHYRDRSQVSPLRDALGMSLDVLRIRLNALRGAYPMGQDAPAAAGRSLRQP